MPETQSAGAATVREYETIYVLRPDVTKDNAQRIATRVEEVVGRENGKLTQVETWGRRSLAYEVKHFRRGVYVCVKYLGGGGLVNELERNFRMLDDVLKYQTVQVRKDVDVASIDIKPDDVKFDVIEPPAEGEEPELTRERILGLDQSPEERMHRPPDDIPDDDDGDDFPVSQEDD
jgi:small subunit ribosomal protein S6